MNSKYIQQFKKGALEMVLLSIVSRGRTYGYEIIQNLGKYGSPIFQNIKEGTLYPVLYRLEDSGFVSSRVSSEDGGRSKKYYEITKSGKEMLNELWDFWDAYKECIDKFKEEM